MIDALRRDYTITLLQPVIVSESSATTGAHRSLDYLPGSLFLGYCAARLYAQLPAQEAWTLFHSGAVRFADANPLTAGNELALPVPLSLHAYKGQSPYRAEYSMRLDGERVFDAAYPATPSDTARQAQQLRGGYLTGSGLLLKPSQSVQMKTAIAADGRAAQGQLYGYSALTAGQRFNMCIEADQDVAPALLDKLEKALLGTAHFGRSRSAQFGAVSIEKSGLPSSTCGFADNAELATFWLLSDLALLDEHGQPSVQPNPAAFGLPDSSEWLVQASFLRQRRYSPYNAKRRSYDCERQVLTRGSVIRFRLTEPQALGAVPRTGAIGLFRESGLGRYLLNPAMLAAAKPVFTDRPDDSTPLRDISAPDTPLIISLRRRSARFGEDQESAQRAGKVFSELCVAVARVRSWQMVAIGTPLENAPGRSQWGRLRELGNAHRHRPEELWGALFNEKEGLLRARSGWELDYGPSSEDTLCECFRQRLLPYKKSPALPDLLMRVSQLGLSSRWRDAVDPAPQRQGEVAE